MLIILDFTITMLKKVFIQSVLYLSSSFLLITTCSNSVAKDVVRYVYSEMYPDAKQNYFIDVLTLALETTKAEFGDYILKGVAIEMPQERTSRMLERDEHINLTWRMTSKDLEQKLQAIYVPLLKGIMGYRIFIIRKGEQHFFPKTMTLQQLKKIHVGQGLNWPDSQILQDNGYNLSRASSVHLLEMLINKRFDYFPRALHEPWAEINESNNNQFVVEQNFVLKYPSPIYFFVNKNNIKLANRLQKGLTQLVKSGEFDHFFATHPITSNILTKSNLKERTVFELTNQLMSEKTRKITQDSSLWLKDY